MQKLLALMIAGAFAVTGTTVFAQDKKADGKKAEAKKDEKKDMKKDAKK